MSSNVFNVGDSARVTATFTDLSGVAGDPTTVVFKAKDPTGLVSSITTTKTTTGVYYADLPLTLSGIWFFRFEGTGALVAAIEGRLTVKPSAFYQ